MFNIRSVQNADCRMHCKNVQNVLSKFTALENGTWKTDWWSMFLSKLNRNHATLPEICVTSQCHERLELTELGISWKCRGLQCQHYTHVMSTSVTFRRVWEEKLILNYTRNFCTFELKARRNPDETSVLTHVCWLLIRYNYRLANHNLWFPRLAKFHSEWSRFFSDLYIFFSLNALTVDISYFLWWHLL